MILERTISREILKGIKMNIEDLPYKLPQSTDAQLRALAKILDIPHQLVRDSGQLEIDAISGVILHRHLNSVTKAANLEFSPRGWQKKWTAAKQTNRTYIGCQGEP